MHKASYPGEIYCLQEKQDFYKGNMLRINDLRFQIKKVGKEHQNKESK